jgi:hypothetical protein
VRHCSLFAGCDAVGIAVGALGGETVAYSEFDPAVHKKGKKVGQLVTPDGEQYAQRVLAKRLPGARVLGDVTKVDWEETQSKSPFAFASAGFPCTDLSVAGLGRGLDGDRSGLYVEVIRMIREARPELALIENVPRLLSLHYERLLRDLADAGYDCEWDTIPAAAVSLHHLRWRLWILAYPSGQGIAPRVMGQPIRRSKLDPWRDDGVRWPNAGMMSSGIVFESERLVPSKGAIKRVDGRSYWVGTSLFGATSDSALVPSPVACDWKGDGMASQLGTVAWRGLWPESERTLLPTPAATSYGSNQGGAAGRVGEKRHSLESMARNGLLPDQLHPAGLQEAPLAAGGDLELGDLLAELGTVGAGGDGGGAPAAAILVPGGSRRGPDEASLGMWPTPSRADGTGGPGTSERREGGKNLRTEISERERGLLEPGWVEWLMGLPVGWTDLSCDEPVYRMPDDEPLPRVSKECPDRRWRLQVIGNSLCWPIPYLLLSRYRDRVGALPGSRVNLAAFE